MRKCTSTPCGAHSKRKHDSRTAAANNNQQCMQHKTEREEGERGEREKGEEERTEERKSQGKVVQEREKKEAGEETKMEKGGQDEEEKDKEIDEDVTGWVHVRRKTRRRVVREGDEDEGGKSCRTVQIFVKVDGSRTIAMDVSQNDKVSDIMKRIPSGGDMYVTNGGRFLRRRDKIRSCVLVTVARFRSRAGCVEEEDTRTRRTRLRRNRL